MALAVGRHWRKRFIGIIDVLSTYYSSAARRLLEKGAEINAVPEGFDYAGTGLHYAALNGHRAMIEFLLEHGADRNVKDTKVGSTAAGWAEYGKHPELLDLLSTAVS